VIFFFHLDLQRVLHSSGHAHRQLDADHPRGAGLTTGRPHEDATTINAGSLLSLLPAVIFSSSSSARFTSPSLPAR